MTDPNPLVDAIRRRRFRYVDEDELQRGLAAALEADGFEIEREVILSPRDRIDILAGRVGIEVKVAGQAASVVRQLERYAESDRVDELVLVTSRVRHLAVPSEIGGKPVSVVAIAGGGL